MPCALLLHYLESRDVIAVALQLWSCSTRINLMETKYLGTVFSVRKTKPTPTQVWCCSANSSRAAGGVPDARLEGAVEWLLENIQVL